MFEPVFVFDSAVPAPSPHVEVARQKGFRMVDIRESASVHGGNPAVIIYDSSAHREVLEKMEGGKRFFPLKNTGVVYIGKNKSGCVFALPDPVEFLEWFFGKEVQLQYYNRHTGVFNLVPAKNLS